MRLVGGVQGEAIRDAPTHPGVPFARVLRVARSGLTRMSMAVRSLIRLRGQKTVAQSFFMLTTVQPSSPAAASDASAPFV